MDNCILINSISVMELTLLWVMILFILFKILSVGEMSIFFPYMNEEIGTEVIEPARAKS